MSQNKLHELKTFLRQTLTNPAGVGAACPSSRWLAGAIAKQATRGPAGVIIELGPGTGVVTQALLDAGLAPESLKLIEYADSFVEHLTKRFPELDVIHGSATDLFNMMQDHLPVAAIVSGLPLRSMPMRMVWRIGRHAERLLAEDGLFIQFTYDLLRPPLRLSRGLKPVAKEHVWRNFPPARVDIYAK